MTTITIKTATPFRPLRALYFAAVEIGIISVGVWLDSAAMQWLGFIGVFLAFIIVLTSMANSNRDKNTDLSIDEARARLDEIEQALK